MACWRCWLPCSLLIGACAGGADSASQMAGARGPSTDPDAVVAGAPSEPVGDPAFDNSGASGLPASAQQNGGCNDLTVAFHPLIPQVLLVIDRSGSMFDQPYADSPTRWAALDKALMAPDTGVIAEFADRVRFGMLTYTADVSSGQCPILKRVEPALDNYDALRAAYAEQGQRPAFKADTPTGAALMAAADQLRPGPDATDPRQILLVTDGEPDDCVTPDPQCGQDLSVAAVQAAHASGVGTSVVGISGDVTAGHLQALANAGRGLPVAAPDMQYTYNCINPGFATLSADYAQTPPTDNAPVFQPENADQLAAALRTLIRGVSDCGFELQGEVNLEKAHLGTVKLDGQPLAYEADDGWRMRSSRVLELRGSACQRAMTDSDLLQVSFPCEVIEVQ